jgi:hypothetical protein
VGEQMDGSKNWFTRLLSEDWLGPVTRMLLGMVLIQGLLSTAKKKKGFAKNQTVLIIELFKTISFKELL